MEALAGTAGPASGRQAAVNTQVLLKGLRMARFISQTGMLLGNCVSAIHRLGKCLFTNAKTKQSSPAQITTSSQQQTSEEWVLYSALL